MPDSPTSPAEVVLYDAALGGTPDTQGKIRYRTSPSPSTTQTFVDGATVLDSTAQKRDAAGYVAEPALGLILDRDAGYVLTFAVQVIDEDHDGSDKDGDGVGDRAGFSVLLLSSDTRGIELGFWPDRIWVQEDGSAEPPEGALFTQAEGAAFDTTRLVSYALDITGETYRLSSGNTAILSGRLRDYTAFEGPVNPYRTPNFIFLGDDTTSAQARVRLTSISLLIK
jgi:hypothetical protein